MNARRFVHPNSTPRSHRSNLLTKSGLRVALVLGLAISLLALITVLAFAQQQEKVLQAESKATPARGIERPKKATPAAKDIRKRGRAGNSDQDREVASQSQPERGEHGERRPREFRMRRARPFTGDLRQLPQGGATALMDRPELEGPEPNPGFYVPPGQSLPGDQGGKAQQTTAVSQNAPNAPAPPPSTSFEGLNFGANGNGHPPDTNGDVGPNYYIQSINTSIGIFDKSTGNLITAPTFNTFMSQGHFGNLCDTNNFGDPVVLYDTFEDRWVITDFAFTLNASGAVINPPGSFQCVAVSRSGDPVSGGWNFYSVNTAGGLGDYPKFGIWTDGLYMSANMFNFAGTSFLNPRAYAFNKAQMYAGAPTVQIISFDAPSADFTILPSNARLQTGTPPAGTPNYYLSSWEFTNALTVYKFHVDWNNPAASTFTGPDIPLAATSWPNASVPNAPSQGGNALDVLQIRAMMQNQYTNLAGGESLWAIHTVRRGDTGGFAAPRFYQVSVTGGVVGPNITQAATFDPDGANVIYRFMPSLAVDHAGNLAFGYSTSSSTTKPAIKYAGRLATDPINTFSQTEQVLIQGAGTQTGNCGSSACIRWGDYSAMTLDPDGCTFWYTNEYYQVDGLNHHTRIGSFNLPQCTAVGVGSIQGTVTSSSGGGPIPGATVVLGSRTTTADASGFYSFANLAAGTYPSITASYPGYTTVTVNSLVVNSGSITNQDFSLSPDQGCFTDTSQADFKLGSAVNVDMASSPGDLVLAKPNEQNQNISTSGFSFSNTSWAAQTFQPQVTGQLTQVDLAMFCSGCSGTNPNVTVSIRNTSGDLPTGADLATATIPGFSSGAGQYYSAVFSSPPTLTAGTRYAIVFRLVSARAAGTGVQAYLTSVAGGTGPYANGRRASSGNSGSTWTGDSTRDLGFITHMISGYVASGSFTSSPKDANPAAGGSIVWTSLSWTAATPASTQVQFQVAANNNILGPFSFVGPDGTAATFFTTSGASLAQFNGLRYLKYQALLSTSDGNVTPVLSDVTVCRGNTVPTTLTVGAATGTYGGTVDLSSILTDGVSPLSGKTIAFKLNGNDVGSAVTDGSGIASLTSVSLAGINANTYPTGVAASFTGDAIYLTSNATNGLTVKKADATIVVTPYHVGFDTNSHTATGTATGVNGESVAGLNLNGTTHTASGDYSDTWTFTDVTGNYNGATGTVNDVISPASSATNVVVANAVYDGSPHGATSSATGVGGLNQLLVVSYSGRNSTVYGPSTTAPTNAGDYSASAAYTGDADHAPSADAKDYSIFKAPSTTTVTCPLSVVFTGSQLTPCTATAVGAGGLNVSVQVGYGNNIIPGTATASATYLGDPNHNPSSGSATFVITAPPFNFVIGDNNAAVGSQVTFWGAQWAKLNSASGGSLPASFKGFANVTSTQPATCGGSWTSGPGNSSGPPAAIPEYITLVVSSSVNKNGSTISGNIVKLVIVKTNPGYGPDPSQPGTGTVFSVVCP